jgi:hypothetical protein
MIARHFAALRGPVCLAVLLTLNAPLVYAQLSSAGTFSGLVTDQQGAAVSEAAVLLLDTSTNTTQRTVTNEAGRYFFLNVAPGVYDLSVNKRAVSTQFASQVKDCRSAASSRST